MKERDIERLLIERRSDLKYSHRPDLRGRAVLESSFGFHFEPLNRVRLTDGEFLRLLERIVMPDMFTATQTLRGRNTFERG
ncbi:hypothetical protein [Deinococcus sp.]|uniref:hypothetical protein n=1 Tax=Deinococcus sp. TaxID=47478 RepID=UPI003C7BA80D